jgi:polyhydroxyalkanoate synthesis repressor PhaR
VDEPKSAAPAPITIKKYANRRLYNTATSSYVTLDHLAVMVKDGQDFVVFDAKTGDEITRSVLTQIIFEEESKGGQNLLPIRFLRQLIRFYGDSLQALVPGYLELSMESFTKNREQVRSLMVEAFGGKFPFSPFEDIARQNLMLFDRALRMFSPLSALATKDEATGSEAPQSSKPEQFRELETKLEAMQKQIDELTKGTR